MLQRCSKIKHPGGDILETPLLVPSFSSKGFRYKKVGRKITSEVTGFLKSTSQTLTESVLFSAYDIHKGFIPRLTTKGISCFPQFTFIDSGGYETSEGYDLSEVFKYPVSADKKWNIKQYQKVLKNWPQARFPSIMISYDHGQDKPRKINRQISTAKTFFNPYKDFLHDFLIKPSEKNELLDIQEIISNVSLLSGFDIIGLTEKELGNSISERVKNIVLIRTALDKVDNPAPLHIFGSLDPITSVVYFLAGAEIFDGLTWLRFGYQNGQAVYQHNYSALKHGIQETDIVSRDLSFAHNLVYLRSLQSEMKRFASTKDFNVFSHNADFFKQVNEYIHTLTH